MQGKRLFIARVMTCKSQEEAQAFRNLRLMMLREEFEGEQGDDDEDAYPAEDLIGLQVSVLPASTQALPCTSCSFCLLHAHVPCQGASLCLLRAQAGSAVQVHMLLHPEGQPEVIGHVISIHEGMGRAPPVQLLSVPPPRVATGQLQCLQVSSKASSRNLDAPWAALQAETSSLAQPVQSIVGGRDAETFDYVEVCREP